MEKKKGFNFRKFLIAMTILLILGGAVAVFISLIIMENTEDGIGIMFYIPIILIVFWGAAIFVGKKIKYYCPNCGERLRKTGRQEETGDFQSRENGNTTIITERVRVEYECYRCKYTRVIDEKHKVGSIS